MKWFFRRKPKPVYLCEVCGSEGVNRTGRWDYCPKGHSYVSDRA